jgi:signal transduction histidine kinase
LPLDSILAFKERTIWDDYKWHIIGLITLCVVQAVLIAGLVTQRVRRSRAERQLLSSREELQDLTGKLLVAHEVERRRIACELHDDFGQEMALLSVEIDLLHQKLESDGQVAPRIAVMSDRVKQLSSSIHVLSHQLHPMKLEQLGPVAAIRGLCKELTQSHSVNIEFVDHHVPEPITDDIALCIYRIAQESLRNVVKHSGAQKCNVELSGLDGAVCLRVHDDGLGFDPRAVDGGGGLGLVSMRERLRAVGGEIELQSNPRGGTELVVRIPFKTGALAG